MEKRKSYGDLKLSEDVSIKAYYSEDLDPKLRDSLKTDLGEIYEEKYTSSIPEAETVPILTITKSDEVKLLIGDEISLEALHRSLKE